MSHNNKKSFALLLLLLASFFLSPLAFAEEQKSEGLGFSIEPILPDNQIDVNKGYFDLKVAANTQQKVVVAIYNNRDQEITVKGMPYTAGTNTAGVIDYSGTETILADTLEQSFEEMTSKQEAIKISPKEKKQVTFTIDIPADGFNGSVLGGFYFSEVTENEPAVTAKKAEKKNGASFVNDYAIIVACQMRMDETDIKADFDLETPILSDWNNYFAVVTQLVNTKPVIVSDYLLKGEIVSKKTNKRVLDIEESQISMAPNSKYKKGYNVQPALLPAGEYTYKVEITKEGQVWKKAKDFTVTAAKKKEVLQTTLDKKEPINGLQVAIIVLLSVVILLIIAGLIIYKRQEKKKQGIEN